MRIKFVNFYTFISVCEKDTFFASKLFFLLSPSGGQKIHPGNGSDLNNLYWMYHTQYGSKKLFL